MSNAEGHGSLLMGKDPGEDFKLFSAIRSLKDTRAGVSPFTVDPPWGPSLSGN